MRSARWTTSAASTSAIAVPCSPTGRASSPFRRLSAVGTVTPRPGRSHGSRTTRAHSPGSTPCTTGRTGRSTSRQPAPTRLLCSPYKFYGPHLGLVYVRRELAESCAPTRCVLHPTSRVRGALRNRHARARAPGGLRRGRRDPSERRPGTSSGSTKARWAMFPRWVARQLGAPRARRWMEGRAPTFAVNHQSMSPRAAALRLGERGFAVLDGNYYAVEIMNRLGLPDGVVSHRHRPLQHGRRGRPAARRAVPPGLTSEAGDAERGLQRTAAVAQEIPVGSRRPDQRDADRQAAAAADIRGSATTGRPVQFQ